MTTIKNPLAGIEELPVRWETSKYDSEASFLFIGSDYNAWVRKTGKTYTAYTFFGIEQQFNYPTESEARAKCLEIAIEFLNKLKG